LWRLGAVWGVKKKPRGDVLVTISRAAPLSERGQGLVEYAIILALIGVGLIVILGFLGRTTRNVYDQTASALGGQTGAPASSGGMGGGLAGGVRVTPASPGNASDSTSGAGSTGPDASTHTSP
jgi:Flp pilus assembly pilin Flp